MPEVVRRRQWPQVSRPVRNALLWALAMIALSVIGAVGYMVIEGWSFFDSLYMTVNTLATVGFREIAPMNRVGEAEATGIGTAIMVMPGRDHPSSMPYPQACASRTCSTHCS